MTRMTKDIQCAFNTFSERCNSMSLELTTAKTEIVNFSKKHTAQQLAISLGGPTFLTKNKIPYLGLEFNRKLSWIDHVNLKWFKAKQVIMQFKKYIRSTYNVHSYSA